jgi:Flp pilus assembly protein TadD
LIVFENAHALDRNLVLVCINLATTLVRLGRPDEAIPYAKQAIRLDPLGPQVAVPHIDLGNAHLLRAEYLTAIEWFRRAKSLNSRLPRLYPGFAAALAHTGQLNEARGVVRDLLDLAPHFRLSRSPDYPTPYSPPEYVRLFESVYLPGARLAGLPE